jgi:protein-L-isoaspartate(D-aspartate) O-methyltransferase
MLEAAGLEPDAKVLEIGAGSGYAAALLSRITRDVYAIERHDALTAAAVERFRRLGYTNIELKTGDGSGGWPERAPFDAIIVSAGGPDVPQALKRQLRVGGVMVVPVGAADEQRLKRVTRTGGDSYEEEELGAVRFVKLIGEGGWSGP